MKFKGINSVKLSNGDTLTVGNFAYDKNIREQVECPRRVIGIFEYNNNIYVALYKGHLHISISNSKDVEKFYNDEKYFHIA
jgi:hypothetical protein